MSARPLLLALALAASTPGRAGAQVVGPAPPAAVVFPDSAKFARGAFAEGDLGVLFFLGKLRVADPGPAFHVRLGYDLFRWLAVQAHLAGTTASANAPAPLLGQIFQMYLYGAEARAQIQIRRVGLYLQAGAGVAHLSSNVFEIDPIHLRSRVSFAVIGGAGIDLHTLNRHFSVGLAGDYLWLQSFGPSHAIAVSSYIRYTR